MKAEDYLRNVQSIEETWNRFKDAAAKKEKELSNFIERKRSCEHATEHYLSALC